MRSIFLSLRLGTWLSLLLALGMLSGPLPAQSDVENLAPPGEEAPALPDQIDSGLFNLDEVIKGPKKSSGADKEPAISVTWSPLSGEAGTAVMTVHFKMQKGENTYDIVPVKGTSSKPTKITIDSVEGLIPIDKDFVGDRDPELIAAVEGQAKMREYLKEVTFLRRYRLTADRPSSVQGKMDFQICTKDWCRLYHSELSSEWSDEPYTGPMPDSWKPAGTPPTDTAQAGASSNIDIESSGPPLSCGYALLLAFVGGIIMNVMPCVLPVIAIKVLSFVQQAGESRSRIFALNLTYSIGVIVVFLGLGTLATFARIGLGELFQYNGFNVVMACVVFAMGLSLLGVFEFQFPGSVGSGGAEQEGLTGAFFTGVLATLLATPCIGPFVSGVLVWSVTQPTAVIYAVWGMLGLGMASPYLLIGAFPALINRMPRPGMWMVRFKEFSGFVLMATVIWLINSISPQLLIPTLIILLGVALALWMLGNLYDHSSTTEQKWKVRLATAIVSLPLIGYGTVQHVGIEKIYALFQSQPETEELPWEPFTEARLVELRQSGHPILIDFTADWCAVCKVNEKLALNTKGTADFVKAHQIACLKADYTRESEEIRTWLKRFKAAGVPLTVIFPPGEKARGIPFSGLFSQSGLLTAMEKAWGQTGETTTAHVTSQNGDPASQRVH